MIPPRWQVFIAIGILAGTYTLGFLYGQASGRESALARAVVSFQNREKINHEIESLDSVGLCIALGGLPDECATLMRGVAETAESKQSGNDGK